MVFFFFVSLFPIIVQEFLLIGIHLYTHHDYRELLGDDIGDGGAIGPQSR